MTRLLIGIFTLAVSGLAVADETSNCPAYLDHDFRRLHTGQTINLCELYSNKPMLIVNTASHCGFTDQFAALQEIYSDYRAQGLQVVGFASNDFDQEADSEAEAANICYINFGVEFTMIAPSAVTGSDANPVFAHLATVSRAPDWNFAKYLLNPNGAVDVRLSSRTPPDALRQQLDEVFAGE